MSIRRKASPTQPTTHLFAKCLVARKKQTSRKTVLEVCFEKKAGELGFADRDLIYFYIDRQNIER